MASTIGTMEIPRRVIVGGDVDHDRPMFDDPERWTVQPLESTVKYGLEFSYGFAMDDSNLDSAVQALTEGEGEEALLACPCAATA
jgi:hypothetical protein